MCETLNRGKVKIYRKFLSSFLAAVFSISFALPAPVYAQYVSNLPKPGEMVALSAKFEPTVLKGITLNPANPLQFDFIVDRGEDLLDGESLKAETERLLKYFLTAMTIPDDESWVNLSPYEGERIIPDMLATTEMGKQMLEQDYLLKQLSASLTNPESELGQKFWQRVYQRAYEQYGTTDVPITTFNKVWVVPDKAVLMEQDGYVYVGQTHLKVMLDQDYVSVKANLKNEKFGTDRIDEQKVEGLNLLSSAIVKEVIIPELEREVNEGKNFAAIRQMYHSIILAVWYKQNLKESLLGRVYVNKNKIKGVDTAEKGLKEKVYRQYLEAFRKGVYNLIKEDYDVASKAIEPRKYFSGGVKWDEILKPGVIQRVQPAVRNLTPEQRGQIRGAFSEISGITDERAQAARIATLPEVLEQAGLPAELAYDIVKGLTPVRTRAGDTTITRLTQISTLFAEQREEATAIEQASERTTTKGPGTSDPATLARIDEEISAKYQNFATRRDRFYFDYEKYLGGYGVTPQQAESFAKALLKELAVIGVDEQLFGITELKKTFVLQPAQPGQEIDFDQIAGDATALQKFAGIAARRAKGELPSPTEAYLKAKAALESERRSPRRGSGDNATLGSTEAWEKSTRKLIQNNMDRMIEELTSRGRDLQDIQLAQADLDKVKTRLEELLPQIAQLWASGQVNPQRLANLRLGLNEPARESIPEEIRTVVFPVAGNPLHWTHVASALEAMVEHKADGVVIVLQGLDERKPDLLPFDFRYQMGINVIDLFSPFIRIASVSKDAPYDGETNISRIAGLNPEQKIAFTYLVGADHSYRTVQKDFKGLAGLLQIKKNYGIQLTGETGAATAARVAANIVEAFRTAGFTGEQTDLEQIAEILANTKESDFKLVSQSQEDQTLKELKENLVSKGVRPETVEVVMSPGLLSKLKESAPILDTIAKLENAVSSGTPVVEAERWSKFNPERHQISVFFIPRDGESLKEFSSNLDIRYIRPGPLPAASSTDFRKGRQHWLTPYAAYETALLANLRNKTDHYGIGVKEKNIQQILLQWLAQPGRLAQLQTLRDEEVIAEIIRDTGLTSDLINGNLDKFGVVFEAGRVKVNPEVVERLADRRGFEDYVLQTARGGNPVNLTDAAGRFNVPVPAATKVLTDFGFSQTYSPGAWAITLESGTVRQVSRDKINVALEAWFNTPGRTQKVNPAEVAVAAGVAAAEVEVQLAELQFNKEDDGAYSVPQSFDVAKLKASEIEAGQAATPVGGIDFDPSLLDLQIKRDGKGIPLPMPQQNIQNINIEGLYPVIINIQPATLQNFPFLFGANEEEEAVDQVSLR